MLPRFGIRVGPVFWCESNALISNPCLGNFHCDHLLGVEAGGVYEQAAREGGGKICLFESLVANQHVQDAGGPLYGELEFRCKFGNETNVRMLLAEFINLSSFRHQVNVVYVDHERCVDKKEPGPVCECAKSVCDSRAE